MAHPNSTTQWPNYGKIDGAIVVIGFGSIGRGVLPLIERHFTFDKSRFVVIDPSDENRALLDERGLRFMQQAITLATTPYRNPWGEALFDKNAGKV